MAADDAVVCDTCGRSFDFIFHLLEHRPGCIAQSFTVTKPIPRCSCGEEMYLTMTGLDFCLVCDTTDTLDEVPPAWLDHPAGTIRPLPGGRSEWVPPGLVRRSWYQKTVARWEWLKTYLGLQ